MVLPEGLVGFGAISQPTLALQAHSWEEGEVSLPWQSSWGRGGKTSPPKMTGQAGGLAGRQGVQVLAGCERKRGVLYLEQRCVSWIVH